MFTDIPLKEIETNKSENINDLKILLANEATSMLYGKEESKKCYEQAKKIFSDKSSDEGLPIIQVNINEIKKKNLSDLIISTRLEESKSEIKLSNPISSELDVLRSSLYSNLLISAKKNIHRNFEDLMLFEIGPNTKA